MSFYTRLIGLDTPKIHIHTFRGIAGEVERGKLTGSAAAAALGLSGQEATDAQALLAKCVSPVESYALIGRTTFTNLGTTSLVLSGITLEGAGVTGAELRVFLNRNGASSTLTFQIADVTASFPGTTQITVTDTTGAGDKVIANTVTFGAPLAAGLRQLVLRGNAGNTTDDPIVLGATLLVRRVAILTPDVLEQVLLLAEDRVNGYATESDLRTRLGT
jgi:hypothetical protein